MTDDQGNAADTRRGDYAIAIKLDRHDVAYTERVERVFGLVTLLDGAAASG
jgi:hypothetical protein